MTASDPIGPSGAHPLSPYGQTQGANLADILERVLDKGIVIVGDIRINLLDIELLTIRLRLLVASVDKAREIGIDWWEHDPALSSRAEPPRDLERENRRLRAEIQELRAKPGSRAALTEDPAPRRRRREATAPRRRTRDEDKGEDEDKDEGRRR
ncbi:gas vesicle protein [Streptomyces filamentosus]|uniref:Gas vesicle structural protein n=1 Tax=Streptomyces filamentosus TaxID=67294 RepID=A0A919EPK1_STRFL|nr:hypothetical protein GCM10017667_50370 [Streptomyces filamentosus]